MAAMDQRKEFRINSWPGWKNEEEYDKYKEEERMENKTNKVDFKPRRLEVGEKYYTVELDLGLLGVHKVALFLTNSEDVAAPKAKGQKDGIKAALWINTKKPDQPEPVTLEDL